MVDSKQWLVCLDLTRMDDILIGYSAFLSTVFKPDSITFLHVIRSGTDMREIIDEFPEVTNAEDFEDLIRREVTEKAETHFQDSDVETRIEIREGYPINEIIEVVNSRLPDLLVVGKKVGYIGEGIVPKRILKYVPSPMLFVPENCRYLLKSVLVGVDFSSQSANAIHFARRLLSGGDDRVTAQHVYRFPAQFFPYTFSLEEKEKLFKKLEKRWEKFVREYEIPSDVKFALTLHKEGRLANTIYDQVIRDQVDLIIVASKPKKMKRLIRQDFTEKMVDYSFGVPLLVQKNKEKQRQVLKSLFTG